MKEQRAVRRSLDLTSSHPHRNVAMCIPHNRSMNESVVPSVRFAGVKTWGTYTQSICLRMARSSLGKLSSNSFMMFSSRILRHDRWEDVGLEHDLYAHQSSEDETVKEDVPQDLPLSASLTCRHSRHNNALRVYHLAHHTAGAV